MEKQFIKLANGTFPRVCDTTLIGNWEEVQGVEAQTIKAELEPETLDGLLIRGYEMKWGKTNENFEQYAQGAFDAFIQDYFIARGLNMPVDINHEGYCNYKAICGRVLYVETNSVGFYFVIYVPRAFEDYEALKWRLKNGIIQGFSKEGYATDWEYKYKENGDFDYELIKQMKLLSVSLVSTPANGIGFEKMQEVKNGLVYVNKNIKQDNAESTFEAMFNK